VSRREAVLSAAAVALAALVVRLWATSVVVFPQPEDTAYYVAAARNLLEGRGLVSDALWSYGTPPLEFPRPAFEVWLPLPSFLAALPMALGGHGFATAQWSSVAVGVLVAVLAWRTAADLAAARGLPPGRARAMALGAGLGMAVYLPLVLFSALPDSTMPFAALVLAACLLMVRLAADPRDGRPTDPRLLGLGLLLGLAALSRNEAAWLALVWAWLAWGIGRGVAGPTGAGARAWLRLVVPVAAVSLAVFTPWAWRDWLVFGSPFPGQALANALSLDGQDIFAWSEPVTLERYLAAGPATLVGLRLTAFAHDLGAVLAGPGAPASVVGLVGLWAIRRERVLRPLLGFSVVTFVMTTLLFPVSTTWGTFLHAAGAIHVLVVIGAAAAFDALLAALGRRRGWTRPTAWLGGLTVVVASGLMTAVLLPGFGAAGRTVEARYRDLPAALAAAGLPLEVRGAPVITDFPIWLATETGAHALALPDESPAAVLDLARTFPGTTLVIVEETNGGLWPEAAWTDELGRRCFEPVGLPDDPDVRGIRVFRIRCP
jgi:hypothetical protein